MKKAYVAILLLSLSGNLLGQSNALDSIQIKIPEQPTDEKKDSIFFDLLMKYAWYKPDSSLYFSQQEISLGKKLHSAILESRALSRYGYVLGMMGNYPQGIDFLLQAQKMSKQLKDSIWLYWNYVFLTQLYTDEGDFKQARFYAQKLKGLKVFEEENGDNEQWFVRTAAIYERMGQLDSALFYGRKALAVEVKNNGKPAWTTIVLTLADIYARRKAYDSALHYYRIAALLSVEGQISKEFILSYNGMADVYRNTGPIDSAFYYAYKFFIMLTSRLLSVLITLTPWVRFPPINSCIACSKRKAEWTVLYSTWKKLLP